LADQRLRSTALDYNLLKITDLPLPFANSTFDFICCYETIEHVYNYREFIAELVRVLSPGGIVILTCPNVAWEWVHWVTAIININHSEGPHRFLRRRALLTCFADNELQVLEENSTVVLPFNNRFSIKLDDLLEAYLPPRLLSALALRRTFVLTKPVGEPAAGRALGERSGKDS
jgi:2-polyprenyl-3-methyl-5-hydroxy-6-metoxy-1,4-benzoquinol methylase